MTELLDAPDVDLLGEVQAFLGRDQRLFIDGAFVDSASGGTFGTVDPATGNAITEVAEADAEDIDRAVRAARRAFEGPWSSLAPSQRGMLLHRLADAIEAHADEFAQIESIDNGKPAAFALAGDVALAVEHFRYFAGWATKIEGSSIQTSHPDMHVYTRREPVGVVGAIIPWNFPLLMAAWKLAPALAAGCTVVLKPAEQTPLSVLRLAELIAEAGWPEGAVNVCPGYGETAGAALVEHPDVDYIAFTGSTVVGKQIASRAADHVKHVSLELGGKSPNIVFDDADLDAAVAAAANAIFYETGQVCSAGSRLMVQAPVFDEFVDGVVAEARKLQMGRGLSSTTTLGPLVSEEQLRRVRGYVESGVDEGATVHEAGQDMPEPLRSGYFFKPTVLTGVPDSMAVCREEIFGPVLVAQPFESLEEVAGRANATSYGLAAGVWTRDVRKAHRMAALLQAGSVFINCYNAFDASVPFGGFKQSGYGRDGGRDALDKFLHAKAIWTNLA
ncbi:MAG: aldehyde dehydrogenase [Thermoleophilaceae bacterium]|jgi:acyl-CoA reductase-like NAD-dependent aldehyde dehydrogenase|nr:aldehyde dehydrogenase [Thermoleophilaceae bacterium]